MEQAQRAFDPTACQLEVKVPNAGKPLNNNSAADREIVWPKENMFDFPLKVFTAAKTARNKAKRAGNEGVSNTIPYVIYDDANDKPQNKITVLGNPTLEEVSTIMIGVRNV